VVNDEPLSGALFTVLLMAEDAGRTLAERLGVGVSDATALQHLLLTGPTGPAQLGRRLGIGSAAATMLADRLERAGHIERRAHPGDRRRRVLVPTDRAGEQVWAVLEPLVTGLDAVEGDMDEAERAAVRRYLDAIRRAYSTYSA
jgi:DNA-binding MarR family transcriptional regulator